MSFYAGRHTDTRIGKVETLHVSGPRAHQPAESQTIHGVAEQQCAELVERRLCDPGLQRGEQAAWSERKRHAANSVGAHGCAQRPDRPDIACKVGPPARCHATKQVENGETQRKLPVRRKGWNGTSKEGPDRLGHVNNLPAQLGISSLSILAWTVFLYEKFRAQDALSVEDADAALVFGNAKIHAGEVAGGRDAPYARERAHTCAHASK